MAEDAALLTRNFIAGNLGGSPHICEDCGEVSPIRLSTYHHGIQAWDARGPSDLCNQRGCIVAGRDPDGIVRARLAGLNHVDE
jgi:hypothetical protein